MVWCLLHKHGDLGLIASTHVKITHQVQQTCLQSLLWGDGDGGSWDPWPAGRAQSVNSVSGNKVVSMEVDIHRHLKPPCKDAHMQTHTYA